MTNQGNIFTRRYWFRRILCFFGKHLNTERPFESSRRPDLIVAPCHDCGAANYLRKK